MTDAQAAVEAALREAAEQGSDIAERIRPEGMPYEDSIAYYEGAMDVVRAILAMIPDTSALDRAIENSRKEDRRELADRIEALEAKLVSKKTCPLGEDCDLTVAWMAGWESAKDKYEARTEKLDAKLDAAREEGRREEREACYQRAYEYGCVWQELRGLALNSSCPEDATKHLASEQAAFAIAEAIRARAAELKGEKK